MTDLGALLEADDVRLLADIGTMALSRGRADLAEAIFAGVTAARPAQEAGPLGTALVHLHAGRSDAAIAILRRLPPSDAARMFLGMALQHGGQKAEARAVLADLVETAAGTAPAAAAQAMLDVL